MTTLVVERLENADRISLGLAGKISIDSKAPIFLKEDDELLGVFQISYLALQTAFLGSEERACFKEARNLADVTTWEKAAHGSPGDQNLVAGKLLFERLGKSINEISVSDKNLDLGAVEFWLRRALSGGSVAAKANLQLLQKKQLSARFGGDNALHQTDFQTASKENESSKHPFA